MYRCLYNLELLILGTAKTPWQSYDEPIRDESPAEYVRQLKDTDIDALMICPTAWKRVLWHSKIDPHWEKEAPLLKEPPFCTDMTYDQKAYWRLREYMLRGGDPLGTAIAECRKQGIAPFISYRMNDHHYLRNPESPVHPTFWRENPQFRNPENRHFDYMHKEVRDWYFSLLAELLEMYDPDGLELDFMRSPTYFRAEELEKGREVMTEFVRRIRRHMDEVGAKRGKKLQLCVRVPLTGKWCEEVGLDVAAWDAEGIIDMVNVSSYFTNTPEYDIDWFRDNVKNAPKYAELHFVTGSFPLYNGFKNNICRKASKEIYRALAATLLDRGIDGISFFNIDYTRHHSFNEPRREGLRDSEPPIAEFKGITDLDHLAKLDKHYILGPGFSPFPLENRMNVKLYVADRNVGEDFRHAILRILSAEPSMGCPLTVRVNGQDVKEMQWMGELFPPISVEGLPTPEHVHYYNVPTSLLKYGYNDIEAFIHPHSYKNIEFVSIELGVYRNNSFME